jgi:tripartite-type tricarboxylate transporter receptor subunit TctC
MEQAGLKGFEVNNWYALFAPAGTPKDIVARLNTEVVKILALAEVQKRLLESGIVAAPSSPEQLAAIMGREYAFGEFVSSHSPTLFFYPR